MKNNSNCSIYIYSPKGGTSFVKASHWRHVKDPLSELWSPLQGDFYKIRVFGIMQNNLQ